MDTGCLNGQMEKNMREIIQMDNSMEGELLLINLGKLIKENGYMEHK